MTIIHYYARFLTHQSGVTDSIENWARQTQRAGHDVAIVCAEVNSPRTVSDDIAPIVSVGKHFGWNRTSWVPLDLSSRVRPRDVVYLHEGWVASNAAAVIHARIKRAHVTLMPHGVYEPGITSGIRDVASIRRTLERFVVRSAETIHVFYASEAALPAQIAAVDKVDAIVFPNGAPTPDRTENWVGGGGYFLWMGRYDPSHKGLDNLLRQWAALARARPPLVLAGPDYKDGRARTAQLVEELGISGDVTLLDDMRDKEKDTLMRRCSAYLHPSRWESCSIMLLEMLSAGVPTVVSSTIHAAEPLSSAGVAVAHDFSSDADLGLTLSMVRDNHHLGRAASAWVESLATWDRIGERYGGWLDKVSKGAC